MVKVYQQYHLRIMPIDLLISSQIKYFRNNYKSKKVNSLSFNKQSELMKFHACLIIFDNSIFIYFLIHLFFYQINKN